jgi:pyruvate dehydrogenase E2 component (dihydrolipoamide acetyltransferase)
MAEAIVVPQQGNSVESVILLQWSRAEGETIREGETLCEVETDKTTMEVESTATGTVLKLLFQEGDEIPVKTTIAIVGEPSESIDGISTSETPTSTPGEAVEPAQSPVEATVPAESTVPAEVTVPAASSADPALMMAPGPQGESRNRTDEAPGVSPRARRSARLGGVRAEELRGSGPGGRVLERDVLKAMESGQRAPSPSTDRGKPATDGSYTDIPVQGVRKIIAERMRASLATTAQLTMHGSADARDLQRYRNLFKNEGLSYGLDGVNINDMVMYACARTLPHFPELNAHFKDGRIRRFSTVDLSFAVDTERGLMVPTIRNAHELSLRELSATTKALARRCLDGTATADDIAPGTFTVTNLGAFGIEYFTPILNPPQVAILGLNTITLRPVGDEHGNIDHRPHMGLSLTIDHQALDGAPAARFLQELSTRIGKFGLLLAG